MTISPEQAWLLSMLLIICAGLVLIVDDLRRLQWMPCRPRFIVALWVSWLALVVLT